jgi:hypothetical protein
MKEGSMRVSELMAWLRHSFDLTKAAAVAAADPDLIMGGYTPKRYDCFIAGAPGSGKSAVVMQAAAAAGVEVMVSIAVTASPTDARGFPSPNKQRTAAEFLPYGDIARAMAVKPGEVLVWFLDDFGQAKDAVQASFMQLVLTRQINGFTLPEGIIFVLATNRREDRAAVRGILEPMKSRPLTILELEPDHEEWCGYMVANRPKSQHRTDLVGFIRYLPEYFNAFKPTADMVNSPIPRTWDNVLTILEDYTGAAGITPAMIEKGIFGAVGKDATLHFQSFRRMQKDLPDIPSLIADPESFNIGKATPSVMYAVVTAMAMHTTPQNFAGVGRFTELLHEANRGEYAACLLRDVMMDDAIKFSPAFSKIVTGDLAALVGIATTNSED